jgi:hypothetical protein
MILALSEALIVQPSFRGLSEAEEPGIPLPRSMDSGFACAARPGMTLHQTQWHRDG